jgi:type I restriction-modification system DNA methylase subunit
MNLVPGDASLGWLLSMGNHITASDIFRNNRAVHDIFKNYIISELELSREHRDIAKVEGRKNTDLRFFKGILGETLHDNIVAVSEQKEGDEFKYSTEEVYNQFEERIIKASDKFLNDDITDRINTYTANGLIKKDLLEAVIGLGPNIFYGASIAACVMVFRQNKDAAKKGKVLFIDAADQIRVGRAQNYLEPEHTSQIYSWYINFEDVQDHVKVVNLEMLQENDFNLNIPLYVEIVIEENLHSVEEALAGLKEAWQSSLEAEEKFKIILKRVVSYPL